MHYHLLGGLNDNLDLGIITKIVDAVKAFNISTPCDHLENWDFSLKTIECVCMRVRFVRARLSKLVSLSCE
ncbi:hypothetical protein H5410_004050 [Solanum commersonii]|uniref:Uncharacterized protein n=1 Tax=Solanum commersonii TaxID=4109 RepID=A0A9J6B6B1_SOLCO|nr:hypothetical protein H5410_004050 [Solanum commersonii]